MKIGVIHYEYFSKNWHRKQGDSSIQRDMQSSRTTQRDSILHSNHNYTDKYIMQSLPKSKSCLGSNNKSNEIVRHKPLDNAQIVPSFLGLKTAWTNKEIPLVTRGFYGDKLTFDNVSVKINNGCPVLVGSKKSGHLSDKEIIAYFMQFIGYPKYRKYIIDSIDKVG